MKEEYKKIIRLENERKRQIDCKKENNSNNKSSNTCAGNSFIILSTAKDLEINKNKNGIQKKEKQNKKYTRKGI